MAAKLSKGPKKFYEFLRSKKAGDLLTEADILAAIPDWTEVSLYTYRKKNKIAPFLTELPGNQYRVIYDGDKVSEEHVQSVFTRVKPEVVVPNVGDRLVGDAGAYILDSFLGAGAVGQVWKAKSEETGQMVAAKIMLPQAQLLDPATLENVRERFRREARNGLKVSHPHIVLHRDVGEWKKTPFLVMELADASLGTSLKAAGPLSDDQAGPIIWACIDGLGSVRSTV